MEKRQHGFQYVAGLDRRGDIVLIRRSEFFPWRTQVSALTLEEYSSDFIHFTPLLHYSLIKLEKLVTLRLATL
jgi:hypothetical protein